MPQLSGCKRKKFSLECKLFLSDYHFHVRRLLRRTSCFFFYPKNPITLMTRAGHLVISPSYFLSWCAIGVFSVSTQIQMLYVFHRSWIFEFILGYKWAQFNFLWCSISSKPSSLPLWWMKCFLLIVAVRN